VTGSLIYRRFERAPTERAAPPASVREITTIEIRRGAEIEESRSLARGIAPKQPVVVVVVIRLVLG
jgi:hypothetical protein